MKKINLFLAFVLSTLFIYGQNYQEKVSADSVLIDSRVEFYIFNGPYGEKENMKEPAIKFVLSVKNKGSKPIPDLGVTNRSDYVNFFINDSLNNPVSLYNGAEIIGEHLVKKNGTDSYTWWIFEKDAYAKEFTVQWQYMNLYTKKYKVDVAKKTVEFVK